MLNWDEQPSVAPSERAPKPQLQPQPGLQPAVAARLPAGADIALNPTLMAQVAPPTAEDAARRINAADKRIINGKTDVNQLVPFKYK